MVRRRTGGTHKRGYLLGKRMAETAETAAAAMEGQAEDIELWPLSPRMALDGWRSHQGRAERCRAPLRIPDFGREGARTRVTRDLGRR